MAYKFADRSKEWTSWVGTAVAGLAAAVPAMFPASNHYWIELWQALQLFVGGALIFIPQTAGTTAVENESWSLLKAFAAAAPPEYSEPMKPLLATLAGHLAVAEATPAPATPPTPVAKPTAAPVAPTEPAKPIAPLVADPAAALRPLG